MICNAFAACSLITLHWWDLQVLSLFTGFLIQFKPVFLDESNNYPILLVVLNVTLSFASFFVMQTYMTILFLTLMSWATKLIKMNQSSQILDAKRCLVLYTGLEEGMGPFFFIWISVAQILWITMIFLALSMATDGLSETLDVAEFLLYLAMAMATMLQATAGIFCLSDCHTSLQFLGDRLTGEIFELEPGKERQEAEVLLKVDINDYHFSPSICIQKLGRLGPLTGLGLFSIERNTVTSMVSVAVTYIIILIQFKITVQAMWTQGLILLILVF